MPAERAKEFEIPYIGQDVGESLKAKINIPAYSELSDDVRPWANLQSGKTYKIIAYMDSDPAKTVTPIWLVVEGSDGKKVIIKKDDTGYSYDYVNKKKAWWILGLAALVLLVSNKK